MPSLIPDDITWEKVTTYNIGLDLDLFHNRLSFTGDYYRRNTTDLYTVGPNLPQVLGSAAPYGNYASLKTKGWELSLSTWAASRSVTASRVCCGTAAAGSPTTITKRAT